MQRRRLTEPRLMCIIRHIYWKANSAVDWVAIYVAHHTDPVLWIDLGHIPISFRDLVFLDFLDRIHVRFLI